MSTTLNPQRPVRSPLRSAAPWIILPPIIQIGLYFHIAWWFLLFGIPLYYLLIGLLAAFCADGYRTREHALERGMLIGIIVGVGGVVLTVLAESPLLIWFYYFQMPQYHPHDLGGWEGMGLFIILSIIIIILVHLFSIVLAMLGGLLGGLVRFMRQ